LAKKAFRFGVVTGGNASRLAWIALAQRVEELGYASLPGMPVEARPMTTEQAVEYFLEQRERLNISSIQVQERQLENYAPVVARLQGA
jgi:hypothetical protein